MNDIETYKTITLSHIIGTDVDTSPDFSLYIDVPFTPDEVVLKYVSLCTATAYTEPIAIKTTLLGDDQILAVIPKATVFHESFNTPFRCNKPINTLYDFKIRTILGGRLGTLVTAGYLSFTLVFIKWKEK